MALSTIITGTGRCGTGFIAKLLESTGIKCGHETIFSTGGIEQAKINLLYRTDLEADSSWLAAPFLDDDLLKDCTIIHLVRQPEDFLRSALKIRLNMFPGTYSRYFNFNLKYLPEMAEYKDDLTQLAYRYVKWNAMIEPYADIFHRIEDDPIKLLEKMNIKQREGLFSNTRQNSKYKKTPEIDVNQIDKEVYKMLMAKKQEYGY